MILPDRSLLLKSSPGDPVDYYYHWLYGLIYRRRLQMVLQLLGSGPYERLLEIGYGSGILLPELARRANALDAVDQHEQLEAVRRMLQATGVRANLQTGDILSLPYRDGTFQAVVSVSVLEHLSDLDRACAEIERVLSPGGTAVIGFPVANVLTSSLFRWLGYRAKDIHPSGHREILAALRRRFELRRILRLPRILPIPIGLYVSCQCSKR